MGKRKGFNGMINWGKDFCFSSFLKWDNGELLIFFFYIFFLFFKKYLLILGNHLISSKQHTWNRSHSAVHDLILLLFFLLKKKRHDMPNRVILKKRKSWPHTARWPSRILISLCIYHRNKSQYSLFLILCIKKMSSHKLTNLMN